MCDRQALPLKDDGRALVGADLGTGISVILIEAAQGARQAPHAHPTEEVVVIEQGASTFFLGDQQARIVCAGALVVIPARMQHYYANTGVEPLRAVALHGHTATVTETAT